MNFNNKILNIKAFETLKKIFFLHINIFLISVFLYIDIYIIIYIILLINITFFFSFFLKLYNLIISISIIFNYSNIFKMNIST